MVAETADRVAKRAERLAVKQANGWVGEEVFGWAGGEGNGSARDEV